MRNTSLHIGRTYRYPLQNFLLRSQANAFSPSVAVVFARQRNAVGVTLMEQGKTGQLAVALGRRKTAKRSSPTETVGSHQNPDPAQQLKTRQPPPFVGETLDAQEESGALYKRSSVLRTAAAYATIKRERGPLTQRSSRTR